MRVGEIVFNILGVVQYVAVLVFFVWLFWVSIVRMHVDYRDCQFHLCADDGFGILGQPAAAPASKDLVFSYPQPCDEAVAGWWKCSDLTFKAFTWEGEYK